MTQLTFTNKLVQLLAKRTICRFASPLQAAILADSLHTGFKDDIVWMRHKWNEAASPGTPQAGWNLHVVQVAPSM